MFLGQLVCVLALIGFVVFSYGLLEHQYYWLMIMIVLNIVFTPLAVGAALYDYAHSITDTAQPAVRGNSRQLVGEHRLR